MRDPELFTVGMKSIALDKAHVWDGSYSVELDLSMRIDDTAIPRQ